MRLLFLAFSLLFVQSSFVKSAEFSRSIAIDFEPEPVSQYLTQQTAIQIFQDSRGFLWIVTQEGLNKYNGLKLENFRSSLTDSASISTDYVSRVAEDSEGNLWVATVGGGLNKYNSINNSFSVLYTNSERSNSPFSNDIYTIFSDIDGKLWLGYNNAFSRFDPKTGQFRHFTPKSEGLPFIGLVKRFDQSSDGTVWAATQGGVLEINPASNKISAHRYDDNDPLSILSNDVACLIVDSQDRVWAYSNKLGITVIDTRRNETTFYKGNNPSSDSFATNQINDIVEDLSGRVWIATYDGLYLFEDNANRFQQFTQETSGFPSNIVTTIFQSREGKYWVGTFYGISSGSPNLFAKINSKYGGLSSDSVNAFTETADGSLWVATDDGLNRLRPGNEIFEWVNESTYPSISSSDVMSLLATDNTLWVGTYNSGLNRLDLETNETTVFQHSKFDENSLGANGVTSILKTKEGLLLIGTFGGGLSIFNEDEKSFLNLKNIPGDHTSLSNDKVIALFQDSLGIIWIGTEKGLNKFDPKTNTFVGYFADSTNDASISSDMVWAFYEDQEQQLWLGTSGGSLNRWDSADRLSGEANFHHYSDQISLPSSNIYGIESDKNGHLWLSHNKGLTRFDPNTLDVHHFSIEDGLQDSEFNMGASFKSESNEIYFGGNRGFNIIPSEGVSGNSVAPIVSISEIKIMNQRQEFHVPYHDLEKLDLNYEDKMLSVEG